MTDQSDGKTELEKSRDIITQLKQMHHNSKAMIEKLTEFWLLLDGEMKQKKMAKKIEVLISHQNVFYESLEAVVSDYEMECNRIEKESS